MTPLSPIRSEDLKRFLSGWERREAPPPPGVYVAAAGYQGRLVEEYCARYHLIYLVAVYDGDGACRDLYQCCSAQPPADAPSRCFIFGDVEWREELAERCRVETYLYRFGDIREALMRLLEFGMHVRGIPCTDFSIDVLNATGWCEVDPVCCDVSAVKERIIESAARRRASPAAQRAPSGVGGRITEGAPSGGGEAAGGGWEAGGAGGGGCDALVRRVAEAVGAEGLDRLKACLCRRQT